MGGIWSGKFLRFKLSNKYSASTDIIRLYDLQKRPGDKGPVPYLIVPGHRSGTVSHLFVDPTCTYLISTAGNRGWEGTSNEVLLGYEIGAIQ
jgi:transcriptional activator SPT8